MSYNDRYRLSVHAAIFDQKNRVLMLKTTYGQKSWTLPGGAIDPGETIHEALVRECREELGCDVIVDALTGVYFHADHESQAFVFRCRLHPDHPINLSSEHSDFSWQSLADLKASHRVKIVDCLDFNGQCRSAKF